MKRAYEPWIERVLKAWSDWVCTNARWQGAGAGAQERIGLDSVSPLNDVGWGHTRNPGTHSDPTLAEVTAALHAGHGLAQAVHAEVMGLPVTERRVLVARYCGRPVQVERVLPPDLPGGRSTSRMEMAWSGGPLPFAQIGWLLELAPSTCHEALDRAKLRLIFRLEVRDAIRFGRFAPDGGSLREEVPDAA